MWQQAYPTFHTPFSLIFFILILIQYPFFYTLSISQSQNVLYTKCFICSTSFIESSQFFSCSNEAYLAVHNTAEHLVKIFELITIFTVLIFKNIKTLILNFAFLRFMCDLPLLVEFYDVL